MGAVFSSWFVAAGQCQCGRIFDDSQLKLQLRNVYFNENFRDEHGLSAKAARTAKSERTEWAQGFCWIISRGLPRHDRVWC
jgi:hypothetical protein